MWDEEFDENTKLVRKEIYYGASYATSQMDWWGGLEDDGRIHGSCDSSDRYGFATYRGANLRHDFRPPLAWRRDAPGGTADGRSREPLRHNPIRRHDRLRFGLQTGAHRFHLDPAPALQLPQYLQWTQ